MLMGLSHMDPVDIRITIETDSLEIFCGPVARDSVPSRAGRGVQVSRFNLIPPDAGWNGHGAGLGKKKMRDTI